MSEIQFAADSRAHAERSVAPSKIAIAATFTAEPLSDSLEFWIDKLHLKTEIEFAPYNNVIQSLLDPQGSFARNKGGLNVVLIRFEDWYRFRTEREGKLEYFEQEMKQLTSAFRTAARYASS